MSRVTPPAAAIRTLHHAPTYAAKDASPSSAAPDLPHHRKPATHHFSQHPRCIPHRAHLYYRHLYARDLAPKIGFGRAPTSAPRCRPSPAQTLSGSGSAISARKHPAGSCRNRQHFDLLGPRSQQPVPRLSSDQCNDGRRSDDGVTNENVDADFRLRRHWI